jgi:TolA-binding protein
VKRYHGYIQILVLILFLVGATGIATADSAWEGAQALLRDGNYSQARSAFLSYAKDNPESPRVHEAEFNAIKCLYKSKDYAALDTEVAALQRKYPDHPALDDLAFLQAYGTMEQKNWATAAQMFRAFSMRHPQSSYCVKARKLARECGARDEYEKAMMLFASEMDYEAAEVVFRKVAESYADVSCAPTAQYYTVRCLFELHRWEAMREEIERLRGQNPSHPALDDLLFLEGYSHQLQKRWREAESAFSSYLKLYPQGNEAVRATRHLEVCRRWMEPYPLDDASSKTLSPEAMLDQREWLVRLYKSGEFATFSEKVRPFLDSTATQVESEPLALMEICALHRLDREEELIIRAKQLASRYQHSLGEATFRITHPLLDSARCEQLRETIHSTFVTGQYMDCRNAAETLFVSGVPTWRWPEARRYYQWALIHDNRPEDVLRSVENTSEVLQTYQEICEGRLLRALALAQQEKKDDARNILRALQEQNDDRTGNYSELGVRLEKLYDDNLPRTLWKASALVSDLFEPTDREWAVSRLFLGLACITLTPPDWENAVRCWSEVWEHCRCDAEFRNTMRANGVHWLIHAHTQQGDNAIARNYLIRCRDELRPCPRRTYNLKCYSYLLTDSPNQ